MIKDFLELAKMRILLMQLVTFAMGFYFAGPFQASSVFLWGLLGTGLASAGAAFLNHAFEVDIDAKMRRTENRPLPKKRLSRIFVIVLGLLLSLWGCVLLALFVNVLTSFLAFMTVFLYVAVYTPMKRFSWMNTIVGAIPGALPPLAGWAAATGTLSVEGWFLFTLLFVWQLPHFYAIAWVCKDDYQAANLKMIGSLDSSGSMISRQIVVQIILLMIISLFPVVFGIKGWLYAASVLFLGAWFLWSGILFLREISDANARGVLRQSIVYLFLFLIVILLF